MTERIRCRSVAGLLGVSVRMVQQLGHGSVRQTERYLAFLTPEEATVARANAS